MTKSKEQGCLIGEILHNERGKSIRRCIQCGRCTGGCPVSPFRNSFNPRLLIYGLALDGEEIPDELWYCAGCYLCSERCPKDVQLPTIFTILSNIASRRGMIPPGVMVVNRNVVAIGRLYEIDDFTNFVREELGLEPIKPLEGEEIATLLEGSALVELTEGRIS